MPEYDDDRLAASSLILADKMQEVPSKDIGTGKFVIGNTSFAPGSAPRYQPVSFIATRVSNFWMQVYNLKLTLKRSKMRPLFIIR